MRLSCITWTENGSEDEIVCGRHFFRWAAQESRLWKISSQPNMMLWRAARLIGSRAKCVSDEVFRLNKPEDGESNRTKVLQQWPLVSVTYGRGVLAGAVKFVEQMTTLQQRLFTDPDARYSGSWSKKFVMMKMPDSFLHPVTGEILSSKEEFLAAIREEEERLTVVDRTLGPLRQEMAVDSRLLRCLDRESAR